MASLFVDYFGVMLLIELIKMEKLLSKLIITCLVISINYLLSKFLVFKKEQGSGNV